MYQVTIISEGSEIGFGEGYELRDARDEAAQSLDSWGRMMLATYGGEALIIGPTGKRRERVEVRP